MEGNPWPNTSHSATNSTSALKADDAEVLAALRSGDEQTFARIVDAYSGGMLRVAMMYVADRATAEDVVQETWLGVLNGLRNFREQSSLKTWIFSILTNRAKTRSQREARSIAFSALDTVNEDGDQGPSVDPDRFLPHDHAQWPGHWSSAPRSWEHVPEDRLLARETMALVQQAISQLPPNQRKVLILRDIEGWFSEDICSLLGITVTNERVLLHRARSRIRQALENYFYEEDAAVEVEVW